MDRDGTQTPRVLEFFMLTRCPSTTGDEHFSTLAKGERCKRRLGVCKALFFVLSAGIFVFFFFFDAQASVLQAQVARVHQKRHLRR